jgi:Fe(3+) dicitrate transport protein
MRCPASRSSIHAPFRRSLRTAAGPAVFVALFASATPVFGAAVEGKTDARAVAQPGEKADTRTDPRSDVTVIGRRLGDKPEKLDHLPPEIDGTRITVTKKATVTKLDLVPTIADNNVRALFARQPGLMVSEQQTPTQFNLGYRGLGNPQEAEYVLVMEDGLPISTDWIGFPTAYYLPLAQNLTDVEVIRGGNSLLYGPNPAPVVNFVSKRPRPDQPFGGYSENVGGSAGLRSTYNTLQGSAGDFSFRASVANVQSDGQRDNADSSVTQGNLWLGWRPSEKSLWFVRFDRYDANAGNPGRVGYAQFVANPDFAPTPFNRDWVERTNVVLGHELEFGDRWRLDAKAWSTRQNLSNRSAAAGSAPTTTTLVDEQFTSQGLDVRLAKRWGRGNAVTVGALAYHDDAPFRQWTSTRILAGRDDTSGTPRLDQSRDSYYGALFAEAVFRLPHRWHMVPSVRLDKERIDITERVRPPNLVRPLIREDVARTIPLLGFGAGFDFGRQNETYFSVSQGWRPLRFFDVASPFANVGTSRIADPSKSLSWEMGVHGTPVKGLFYDASVFWIGFRNRIETIVLTATDSVNQNSGDTRHRGLEFEVSYDLFAARTDGLHLTTFANAAFLDAEFVASRLANRVGNTPAFAPKYALKYGVTLRKDATYSVSLTGASTGAQFFQDSNLSAGAGATFVPAQVPSYTIVDFAADWQVTRNVRVLGGVSNLADRRYYNRVFQNGIEPGARRKAYAGLSLGF